MKTWYPHDYEGLVSNSVCRILPVTPDTSEDSVETFQYIYIYEATHGALAWAQESNDVHDYELQKNWATTVVKNLNDWITRLALPIQFHFLTKAQQNCFRTIHLEHLFVLHCTGLGKYHDYSQSICFLVCFWISHRILTLFLCPAVLWTRREFFKGALNFRATNVITFSVRWVNSDEGLTLKIYNLWIRRP